MTVKVAKTTSPHTAALESLGVWQTRLGWLSLVFVLVGLGMAFFYAPTEATMGDVYRLFFFHMPAAIAGFAGFFVTFVASIAYLVERSAERDMWAVAGAETGIVFSLAGILGGMFWARPVWNVWWTWDARLTSVTIMMLTYIAYMMLRQAIDDPERRARFAAVMGIVGFVNIPLVWFS
ncbi:MAG: cytochrome C assembly protein, partial [Ardenticatenia bacterium]